jgi:hypothetical protein
MQDHRLVWPQHNSPCDHWHQGISNLPCRKVQNPIRIKKKTLTLPHVDTTNKWIPVIQKNEFVMMYTAVGNLMNSLKFAQKTA